MKKFVILFFYLIQFCQGNATNEYQSQSNHTYNTEGLIEKVHKPDNVEIFYRYDELGRLSELASSDDSINYQISYDDNSHIQIIYDAVTDTSHTFTYDTSGHLLKELLGNGLVLQSKFDSLGRRKELKLPDSSAIEYEYDTEFLRFCHRLGPNGEKRYTHSYTEYDKSGLLLSENLINSVNLRNFTYDKLGQVTTIISSPFSQSLNYYDTHGNLIQSSFDDPLGNEIVDYAYDEKGQIISEIGNCCLYYEYDAQGNRKSKNENTYSFSAKGQVICDGKTNFQYDLCGNLVFKKTEEHSFSFKYDALNRLIEAEIDSEKIISYRYDFFNRLISKTTNNENVVRYLYDKEQEIGSFDQKGNIIELKVLGPFPKINDFTPIAIELKGTVFVPLYDHMGSVRCLVDKETQEVKEFYRYTSFGEENLFNKNLEPITESLNPWRYLSQRSDNDMGFIFLENKFYDPEIGGWISKDIHLFHKLFFKNNPLKYCDLGINRSLNNIWDKYYEHLIEIYESVAQLTDEAKNAIQHELDHFNRLRELININGQNMIGAAVFLLTGFNPGEAGTGIYGNGEINEHVRITCINGILNIRSLFFETVSTLSETHGGNNIHYIFKPTEGWGRDLIGGALSILGYTSPHAKSLAKTWKVLIQEMGGVHEKGLIIHYAHSIGGTETCAAIHLMTPEERKKIRIISFGSATIIPNHGLESATNYVSRRDGVGLLAVLKDSVFGDGNVHYIGSVYGIPFVDHLLSQQTYSEVIEKHGKKFIEDFGQSQE